MSLRLDGRNPLAYMGVRPSQPPQLRVQDRRPTTQDYQNIEIGTFWIIPTQPISPPSNEIWILIDKASNVATWLELDTGGGAVVPGAQYTILTADGSGGYGTNIPVGNAGEVLVSNGGAGIAQFGVATVPGGGTGLSTIAAHNLVVGNGTSALNLIAPDATNGMPLISQGATADPDYGVAVVSGGGTGATTLTGVLTGNGTSAVTGNAVTEHAVLLGGASNAVTNVASLGTSGQILTSNGAAAPTFQDAGGGGFSSINIQTLTTSGTYTPTAGMLYCIVEIVGGGGAGGGTNISVSAASGGGAGGYCKKVFSAATIGASQSVTIGSGGTGVSGLAGGAGGNTVFGSSLMTAGGGGGAGIPNNFIYCVPGTGGTASGGDINVSGSVGGTPARPYLSGYILMTGPGGNSLFGSGGLSAAIGSGVGNNGINGTGNGSGGSGGVNGDSSSLARTGGNGTAGICVVTEYLA